MIYFEVFDTFERRHNVAKQILSNIAIFEGRHGTDNILKVKTRSGNHMLPKIQAVASATDKVGLAPGRCLQLKTWGGEILQGKLQKI